MTWVPVVPVASDSVVRGTFEDVCLLVGGNEESAECFLASTSPRSISKTSDTSHFCSPSSLLMISQRL